jgi:Type I restriction enzyme R protein N terminus (HSDR_N)
MFDNFDFSILNDPGFKEDAVREELITPMLHALGYSSSGSARIERTKALTHPFVYIGSKSYQIKLFPDYLISVDDNHRWILDAKSPRENIISGKNPQQAFSYAIHPDVRAFRYALCNGKQIAIFDVSRITPLLVILMSELSYRFSEVERLLSPLAFTNPHIFDFKPDFGLYQWKLGINAEIEQSFIPISVPYIAKIEDGLFTTGGNIMYGKDWLAVSFDFDEERLQQLLNILPTMHSQEARNALRRQPYLIDFSHPFPEVVIQARLGKTVHSNEGEDYCPLTVEEFRRL